MTLIDGKLLRPDQSAGVMLIILLSSIAAATPFAGLQQFPEGHGFKQWMGNDSKALMKVDHCSIYCIFYNDTHI
jgi:hypothetical protein